MSLSSDPAAPVRPRTRGAAILVLAVVALLVGGGAGYALHSTTVGTTTTTMPRRTCAQSARLTYLRADTVSVHANGTAVVSGVRATLVCGGPDDSHYDVSTTPLSVHLLASASITTLDESLDFTSVPTPVDDLTFYLEADTDGNIFQVGGPLTAATSLTAMFHP